MQRFILFILLLGVHFAYGQRDSVWNVLILKEGKTPLVRDNMVTYQPTGFFLYRNCFYDLQLKDKTKATLRLVNVQKDTLVFVGVSQKLDVNRSLPPADTFRMSPQNISKLRFKKNNGWGGFKKVKLKKHYFLFYKSPHPHVLVSRQEHVFPDIETTEEIVPRLQASGVDYYFEYNGKLYRYSKAQVSEPNYDDEAKLKILRATTTVLDALVNKRVRVEVIFEK